MYQVTKTGEVFDSKLHPEQFIDGGVRGSARKDCVLLTNNRVEAEDLSVSLQSRKPKSKKTRKA